MLDPRRTLFWTCCFALAAGLALSACGGPTPTADEPRVKARECTVLAEVPGPEDFVIQKGEGHRADRLLVSSRDRRRDAEGAIYRVSLRETPSKAREMELRGRGGCSFRPHGVFLHGERLYVINHHEEERDRSADRTCVPKADGVGRRSTSVEVFEVGDGTLTMVQRRTDPDGLLEHANDLVVADDGTLYATAPPSPLGVFLESVSKQKHSKVVRFDPGGSKEWEIFAVLSGYSNGIELVPVGDEGRYDVVVSTSLTGEIYRYSDSKESRNPTPAVVFGEAHDNFTWHRKGEDGARLLLATHSERRRYVQHSLHEEARSPSQVWSLTPDLSEKTLLFEDDGSLVSGVSTAACAGGRLILGQVFGPSLLSCPAEACRDREFDDERNGES